MSSGFPNPRRPALRSRLSLERLEGREVPAALAPISDFTTPNTKALYVPLTVTNPVGTVTFNASSSNSQVQVQVITGGTTIRLSVTGTDASNQPFSGDLTFRLFDTLSPVTSARIVSLVQQGFYNNLTFHRVLKGFVAQGGDPNGNGTGGSGTKLSDEFSTLLTFNSPGLLAMANSGDDTSDSQFFITDPSITLAQQPQNLNFNYTIFGQLVAGFDTFSKLINTPVDSPSHGLPNSPVTITSASVVANDPNGVLRITAPENFTGNSTITVTPSDGAASNTPQQFHVGFVADTVNDPPFLGPIADQTTTVGTGVSFQLTGTDLEHDKLTYSVISATSGGQTVNVQTHIDQATGRVTVTPPAGFVGVIDLKVGVSDSAHSSAPDTQVIKLAVAGNFDLVQSSDTGTLNNDNSTGTNTPTFMILAPTGQTVTVSVNGTSAGTATETAVAGQYQITLPANLLRVGDNAITGTATNGQSSTTLTPLTFSYTPSLRSVYVVPGDVGTAQQVTFAYMSRESAFQDEIGYFKADDASGTVGGLHPGDAGYFAAAMARKQIVFAKGAARSSVNTISANGGDFLVMYLVQNDTSAHLLATNPTNSSTGGPVAFFGLQAANPDNLAHLSIADDPAASQAIYAWEDLTGGGDRDYNDMVFSVRRAGDTLSSTLQVPGAPGHAVTGTVKLQPAAKADTSAVNTTTGGEIGYFIADDATGKLGALSPGDVGYAAAALAASHVLFTSSAAVGTSADASLSGGQALVFYYVPGGTAAGVRSSNPTNALTGSQVAYFSATGANPDGTVHARLFNAEGVARSAPAANEPLTVHMMGTAHGGPGDFDDVVFTVRFGA